MKKLITPLMIGLMAIGGAIASDAYAQPAGKTP